MKQLLASLSMLFTVAIFTVAPAYAASAPDFTTFGYPNVLTRMAIPAGQAATLTSGDITINVPAGAFTNPVTFDLLGGSNATFQALVPSNKTVIDNFAFRVTDTTTNEIIGKFNAPVVAVITNSSINNKSQYLNTTNTSPLHVVDNPVAPVISGHTLKHGNRGAPVGWIVTSPVVAASATSYQPTTHKSNSGYYLFGGLVVLLLIGLVAFIAKNNSGKTDSDLTE
ncbi:MAG: hypothetical protein NVSMB46_03750 [Candidatus Saccharimonadales bacterium]